MQPVVCISKTPAKSTSKTNDQAPVCPQLPAHTPCNLNFHPPLTSSWQSPSTDYASISYPPYNAAKSFAKPTMPENLVPEIIKPGYNLQVDSQRPEKVESSNPNQALYERDSGGRDMVAQRSKKESISLPERLRSCMLHLTYLMSVVLWPLTMSPEVENDNSKKTASSGSYSKPLDALSNSERNTSNRDTVITSSQSLLVDSKTFLEVPYRSVAHSRESFSKYLQAVSIFQMKAFAQLAFLCDMAYVIPELKPRHLFRYHQLKIITSSLDKKAYLAATLKEENGKIGKCHSGCYKEVGSYLDSILQTHINSTAENGETGNNSDVEVDLKQKESNSATEITNVSAKTSSSVESLMDKAATTIDEAGRDLAASKDSQPSPCSCPCEWFICDDESSCTRFLVIQGSDSFASWQTNFHFQPTSFEGLDVLVHSGIYAAATALYEQVLPDVLAHFSLHGKEARLRFTGHSLGGSLATLLALMFQIRGVLPSTSILPVISFGSPSTIYGGNNLLRRMKLPHDHVQSVIMHRDIVPRAFSSDYPDYVTRVLKRLSGSFRDHPCLLDQKLLYAPVGQIFILQPDATAAPSHPLLPDGYGLYILNHPADDENVEHATELRAAQRAFLNMPHPFEILSDTNAYGSNGSILRNHNTVSYTKAIHLVIRKEVKRQRQVQRHQRRLEWSKLK